MLRPAFTTLLALLSMPLAAGQGSDSCGSAVAIGGYGAFAVDTQLAGTDGAADACGEGGLIHNDVWFRWTAPATEQVVVSTCAAADYDTTLAVYADGACTSLSLLACNDDSCQLRSRVILDAVAGVDYLVRVGGWNASSRGTATLSLDPVVVLGNDTCASPTVVMGYGTFSFDTTQAATEGVADACGQGGQIHKDLWLDWIPTVTEGAEFSTCGASWDTTIAVYDGLACPTAAPLACNDDACGTQTRVAFAAVAGQHYLVRVGGWGPTSAGLVDLLVQTATGNSCVNPPVGPDVIVADLPSAISYGGLSGVGSYSLATTACNVGDSTMPWTSASAHHPVIAQNLFRIEGGRIQQLGMSWLKHGFASATGSYCCTCVNPGSNQIMGVGCSDPYGASINGAQPGLGPRSEVDPWTGVFPYPFTTQGQGGDVLYKRLQVANDALDPALHPEAIYLFEGQYVTPDDAAAGNQVNNSSWAPAAVGAFSNGAFTVQVAGATRATQPAVLAWREHDPEVEIATVAAPGDGPIHLAWRVHDNQDGTWRYEYAVHNQLSARAVRSLRVPVAPDSTTLATAFFDVDHHSGEVWSAADWAIDTGHDAVSWSTLHHAQDPNANALRWGTLYSFSLTSTAPPRPGVVALELFVPGTPTALEVATVVPGDGAVGEVFCSPASSNSLGLQASLFLLGSETLADQDLTALALDLPPNQFGYLLASELEDFVPLPGGSVGNLCLGAPIARFASQIQGSGAGGTLATPVDLSALPLQGGTAAQVGETWHFQVWYRDAVLGQPTSNFTSGARVTFR